MFIPLATHAPSYAHQRPPFGYFCGSSTVATGAAAGTDDRPHQGLLGETPQQRSTQPASSSSTIFGGGFGVGPIPQTSSAGGASLFGSSALQDSGNTGSLFANLGGQTFNPRVGGLFSSGASSLFRYPDESDTKPTRPSIFRFDLAIKLTQASPSIRVIEDQAVNFGSDILTITVGENERSRVFSIHAHFLTARSAYFKNALLQSPEQKTFGFPDTDPCAFALYFQLIYTGRHPSKAIDSTDTVNEYTLLCKLYILARTFQDSAATNTALDAIIAKASESGDIPASEHVWIIYKNTDGPCGAGKCILDFYNYEATGEWMKAQGEDAQGFRLSSSVNWR